MNAPWSYVIYLDTFGSVSVLVIALWSAWVAWGLTQKKKDDVFVNYLFLFTLTIVLFAVSRSFGHLVKQFLLLNGMQDTWSLISPFSGAVNSTAFVVIFAFGISFHRFQKVHSEIEYYKNNLEAEVAVRTQELESSKNKLENILNNSNPINITSTNFDLMQANDAYYQLWPRNRDGTGLEKCYESRPGIHCGTDECPLKMIIGGQDEVVQEVSKKLDGEVREFILTARPFRDVDGNLIGMVESFQDITLRKQVELALRESEERFRQVFESNPDPVILASLNDGKILDVNRAFESATGISRLYALNRELDAIGLWSESDLYESFREILVEQDEINNQEAVFQVAGEQTRTGLVSGRVLKVNHEPCSILVIRDITTEKKAEQALVEMDRIKNEFISTAAHELSTPLSAMMGYTEFLRRPEEFGTFSEEQKKDFLNEVYERGEALRRIVMDLLDISRIESGNPLPLELQQTDLAELLRSKVKLFLIGKAQSRIRLELPEKVEKTTIAMDRHRVNQVLDNLLSNAIKYSSPDQEIVLKGIERSTCWEIRVEDRGIGMSPEQVERVFDKFFRADSSDTAISGLGLGMSISKQIVDAHGGTIRVQSVVGKGTSVIFTLPFSRT